MNRTIKFRVWNIKLQLWVDLKVGYENPSATPFWDRNKKLILTSDKNFVYQQFTGLKDKNGKEIYEGDIVISSEDSGTFEIKWDVNSVSFLVGEDLWPNAKLTVIGNIFENKELLNK